MTLKTILAAAAAAVLTVFAPALAEYPKRKVVGVVMWGAGGATDIVARAVNPLAEEALGKPIIILNKSCGTGAISTAFVSAAPADGYALLYGAENPQLHAVMGVSDIDYTDFYPINILGRGVAVISVPAASKYQTLDELLNDISRNPGMVKMGSTGPGGLPSTISALIANSTDFDVTAIPFDGEGPGITAMLGGEVDFIPTGISAAAEQIKAGNMRALAVFNTEPVETLPDVPPITDTIPEMERFLPWGPFYGVFVRRDVPKDVIAALRAAYAEAAEDSGFVKLMQDRGNVVMNISGEEADEFLFKWRQVTAWALQDAGAAKVHPEDLRIPRP